MKNIFLVFVSIMILNACGKKGGGSNSDGPTPSGACVFSALKDNQIYELRNKLVDRLSKRKNFKCGSHHDYKQLSAEIVFQILKYNSNADISSAIVSNDMADFLIGVFDTESCQILELDSESVRLIKQCKWEE